MSKITVRSEEVTEALARVENLIAQLAEPTQEALGHLRQVMATYPPPPEGSTYDRTDTLKNGWEELLILAGDRLGMLSNPTAYGPYVQNAEDQAWMHKGRWQTDQQVADAEDVAVIRFYDQYIQRYING